ncbi:hypothetical protein [Streptomyces sp. ICN441]|uniref:hypothetical protein n=1 Tax=Streptomyces sp. ICN441 TaxID=2558286 RepID=UPI00141A7B80|nr:hypothetical protein [Streptomyces sp. ICN441]
MPNETPRRPRTATVVIVLGVCLALLGGIGAWLLLGRDTTPPCNGLTENDGVRSSVGQDVRPGMGCQALGEAIVKASAGDARGRHSLAQAQALKDVLTALGAQGPGRLTLDPALRRPLATALADYAPDLHAMLGGIGIQDFATKAAPATPPWKSGDGTYHLTVLTDTLRDVLRAIAQDPHSYALLRLAETRTAGQSLAAVPADAEGFGLSVPPTESARALGVLDGIADAVTRDLDASQARTWRAAVLDGLTDDQVTATDGPAPAWLRDLRSTPEEERYESLRAQGVEMTRLWAQQRKMDEQTQQGLLAKVERSALSAYREIEP